jgi:hypothetical protein
LTTAWTKWSKCLWTQLRQKQGEKIENKILSRRNQR